MEVESDEFGDVADDERRIDNADDGFVGDPLLHRVHGDAINIGPVVYLVVCEVFVVDECALEGESAGEEKAAFGEVEISSLDESVQ